MNKKNKTNLQKRRELASEALPEVRKLVGKFDLASLNNAVKMIYAERLAQKELKEAEEKVEALKKKIK